MIRRILFLFITLTLISSCADKPNWKVLFDGVNLDNFTKLNGDADYVVEDNQLIGITKANTPNTFLATKEKYSDFIMEFEVWADTAINSGVQFRSNALPAYQDGRVHGYQVEIESSDRKWAGGIYDEARRGWLYPLEQNPKGQEAFKRGEWNKYRVEAIGPIINTWVNGIQCARLKDDMTPDGFIAFQVHSIRDSSLINKKVKWKNIRIITEEPEKYKSEEDEEVIVIDMREGK